MFKETILNNQGISMEHRLMENFNTRVTINTTPQLITLTLLLNIYLVLTTLTLNIYYCYVLRDGIGFRYVIILKPLTTALLPTHPPKNEPPSPEKTRYVCLCLYILLKIPQIDKDRKKNKRIN